jgi:hypothetical protein
MAACTIASTRENWTGVAGAVRAVSYQALMTPAEVALPPDAIRPGGCSVRAPRTAPIHIATTRHRFGMTRLQAACHRESTHAVKD